MAEKTFNTSSPSATSAIFGTFDINVTAIERAFNVKIVNRPSNNDIGDCVTVSGDEENVKNAYEVLIYLNKMASMNNIITEQSVDYAISMVTEKRTSDLNELDDDCFFVSVCFTNCSSTTFCFTIVVSCVNFFYFCSFEHFFYCFFDLCFSSSFCN